MSSKVGIILSMIFVAIFFAFGVDLISIQYIFSDLDSKATAISYRISKYGTIDDQLVEFIEKKYNVEFTCIGNCAPLFGDEVSYIISKDFKPLVISNDTMHIAIQRTAIIGYLQ